MERAYPPVAEEFRTRIRSVLDKNLPDGWRGIGAIADRADAEAFVGTWREVLYSEGLLGVSWPAKYGGAGLSKLEQVVLVEELAKAGVPAMGLNDVFGIKMLGNTLIRWGTEEQRQHFMPRILSGQDVWCQGFSEPDAGSDLASLRTSAVLDGEEWVINGQKIWTSRALEANWIFVLVRTDPSAPKNRGISFLLVPLDQPGITIRPIRMLSGESEFNEVFFENARTNADRIVGPVNEGWRVAQTLLSLERGEEAATNPILFRAELDRLVQLARERGRLDDPVLRSRLTTAHIRCEIMRFLGYRILTNVLNSDGVIGPEASISKLYWSEYHRDLTRLALDVLGADALVPEGRGPTRPYRTDDPGAPNTSGSWVGAFYNSVAGTIYAGANQIQRSIIAETVLGMQREPRST
jgi:alkylation response protein AidB-like acyl-CoA dehydrogenase